MYSNKEVDSTTNLFAESFAPHFSSWYLPLYPILNTLYFEDLIHNVNRLYQTSKIYPEKGNTLKVFRLTNWNDLKVVILGQDPYPNERATGLAFANPNTVSSPSPALRSIISNVEKQYYDGLKLEFDLTLEKWAKQGVLLFNTALTVSNISGAHVHYWKPFTEAVLKTISDKKQGIIFMLWGKYAQSYESFIDSSKHYILKHEHPTAPHYRGLKWDCSHFKDANSLLEKPIIW